MLISHRVGELLMELFGATYLVTTTHIGVIRNFYHPHCLTQFYQGQPANRMYQGALLWTVTFPVVILGWFIVVRGLGRTSTIIRAWEMSGKGKEKKNSFNILPYFQMMWKKIHTRPELQDLLSNPPIPQQPNTGHNFQQWVDAHIPEGRIKTIFYRLVFCSHLKLHMDQQPANEYELLDQTSSSQNNHDYHDHFESQIVPQLPSIVTYDQSSVYPQVEGVLGSSSRWQPSKPKSRKGKFQLFQSDYTRLVENASGDLGAGGAGKPFSEDYIFPEQSRSSSYTSLMQPTGIKSQDEKENASQSHVAPISRIQASSLSGTPYEGYQNPNPITEPTEKGQKLRGGTPFLQSQEEDNGEDKRTRIEWMWRVEKEMEKFETKKGKIVFFVLFFGLWSYIMQWLVSAISFLQLNNDITHSS